MHTTTPTAPERSLEQRMKSLERANRIRTARADLKDAVYEDHAWDLLIAVIRDEEAPGIITRDQLSTMKVYDLLVVAPTIGRVKALKVINSIPASPSKTIGGLSPRQRAAFVMELHALRRRRSNRGPGRPRVSPRRRGATQKAVSA